MRSKGRSGIQALALSLLLSLQAGPLLWAAAPDFFVDNMDDGNDQLAGSSGHWYTSDDGSGTIFPQPNGPFIMSPGGLVCPGSMAQMSGTAHTGYGALMGFFFLSPAASVDLSAYSAISFYARIGMGSYATIRVELPDVNTDPLGGVCSGTACFDNHGTFLTLSSTWTHYTVPFSSLIQAGWGLPLAPFDPSKVFGIKLTVPPGVNFDLSVDEVAFTAIPGPLTLVPPLAPTCLATAASTASQTPSPVWTATPAIIASSTPSSSPTDIISIQTQTPGTTSTLKATPVAAFEIRAVYPNPSAEIAHIVCSLRTGARLLLDVYNVAGEKICQRLIWANAGNTEIAWDGRNDFGLRVASGVYPFRVTAYSFDGTQGQAWNSLVIAR